MNTAPAYASPSSLASFEPARALVRSLTNQPRAPNAPPAPDFNPKSLLRLNFSASGRYAMPRQLKTVASTSSEVNLVNTTVPPQPPHPQLPRSQPPRSQPQPPQPQPPRPQPPSSQPQLPPPPEPDRTPKLGRPATRASRGRGHVAALGVNPVPPLPALPPPTPRAVRSSSARGSTTRGARSRRGTVPVKQVLVGPLPRAVPTSVRHVLSAAAPPSSVPILVPLPLPAPVLPPPVPVPVPAGSPGLSEASRASSSPSSLLPPGGDIGYTLADLDSIYRDQDSMQTTDARDSFDMEAFGGNNSSSDDTEEDVDVEKLSPESFAQVNLSQDSLDVILPPQMLNSNIFDLPDFPENFLENLSDADLDDADEPPPGSPGNLVIDCPNHNTPNNQEPEIEEEPNEPEQNRPEPNNAPEIILQNRPAQYMLELPADNILGPNIFDDDSNDQDEPNIYDEERPDHNVIELNILEPNLFVDAQLEPNLLEPNIFDEDRPEHNILEHIILEPNLVNGEGLGQNGPLQNGLVQHGPVENEQDERD